MNSAMILKVRYILAGSALFLDLIHESVLAEHFVEEPFPIVVFYAGYGIVSNGRLRSGLDADSAIGKMFHVVTLGEGVNFFPAPVFNVNRPKVIQPAYIIKVSAKIR